MPKTQLSQGVNGKFEKKFFLGYLKIMHENPLFTLPGGLKINFRGGGVTKPSQLVTGGGAVTFEKESR